MTTVTCTLNVARVKISSVEHHSLSKASTAANWSASRVRGTVSVVSYMSNTRTSIFKECVMFFNIELRNRFLNYIIYSVMNTL